MRRLSRQVKAALEKACDSAILAVEVYNKPAAKFKFGGLADSGGLPQIRRLEIRRGMEASLCEFIQRTEILPGVL